MNKRRKTAFGQYLVDQIKASGMSQEAFHKKVGVAKPTFYDWLHSAPPPPETQYRILSVLEEEIGENQARRNKLLDLAAQEREELPADIDAMLKSDPEQWDQVRAALVQMKIGM
jgi:transcriptional regulator with XRE-family HTH domain